jgi:hypothetical protein
MAKPIPIKTSWPNLVGDNVERASAIIRWGTRYLVWICRHGQAPPDDVVPYRVVLYLDKDGFVARTPRVG